MTVCISLVLIRWLAPSLLGIPLDLVLVQSEEEVQPYYENIFRAEHEPGESAGASSETFLNFFLSDPFVKVRAKPLFENIGGAGPHDLLGFRNFAIPNTAEVILIGDSQTYGNNAVIWKNWPYNLQLLLPPTSSVYSMATGSWSALQYYYAYQKAKYFSPKVIVVAFYSGNDALETYALSIASEQWKSFLPERDIKSYGTPDAHFPPQEKEQWQVKFADGVQTIFVPKLRLSSNLKHKAIDAGYEIMFKVAQRIAEDASASENLNIIFTIIPTKEYVYSKKVFKSGMIIDDNYQSLITNESQRISDFSSKLNDISTATYVDVTESLMQAALHAEPLYPEDVNGHPIAAGYNVIAKAIAPAVNQFIDSIPDGFYFSQIRSGIQGLIYLEKDRFWFIANPNEISSEIKPGVIDSTKLSLLRYSGHLYLDK